MSEAFDPYRKWLGIPPSQQPPHHYRLLGIELYESDVEVIDTAAGQRMSYLQELAGGQYVKESQKLLNEVSAARRLLLDPKRKAEYDAELKAKLSTAVPSPPPVAPPPIVRPEVPTGPFVQRSSAPEEETITLNISNATSKLKARDGAPAVKPAAAKTPAAKAPTLKQPSAVGPDAADPHASAASRPVRPRKSINVPAVALVMVVLAGVGVYLARSRSTGVEEYGVEEHGVQVLQPGVVDSSDDAYADRLLQMQKEEQAILKAKLEALNQKPAKDAPSIFNVPNKSAAGPAPTKPTAAPVVIASPTVPQKSIFDLPMTGAATTAAAPATATPSATGATATAASTAPTLSAAEQKAAEDRARAELEASAKAAAAAFTPPGGLPVLVTPSATPTGTAKSSGTAKPSGTPVPSATKLTYSERKAAERAAKAKAAAATPTGTAAAKPIEDVKPTEDAKPNPAADAKPAAADKPASKDPAASQELKPVNAAEPNEAGKKTSAAQAPDKPADDAAKP